MASPAETDPRKTPEAIEHARECEDLTDLLALTVSRRNPEVTATREGNGAVALVVQPTLDRTGRVRMTIDQLAAVLGVNREELLNGIRWAT